MPDLGALPGRPTSGRRPRRRLRAALHRHPTAFWALAACGAGAAWWVTHTATEQLAVGARADGALVEVVVTTRPVQPGDPIDADDVRVALLPRELVPADALTQLPIDATAREPLVAGEALVATRVAPQGAVGVAAVLGPDQRAVAVALDGHHARLEVGQRVDVLATTGPTVSGDAGATRTVAQRARVLEVDDDGLTVAVEEVDAHDVATALATAVVTVVVTPD